MKPIRILWSGLTGRTGREALEQQTEVDGVEIVGGISRKPMSDPLFKSIANLKLATCTDADEYLRPVNAELRWYSYSDIANPLKEAYMDYDVIVDFSHPDVFDMVLKLAVRTGKPLISGTSGLSNRQMATLYDATNRIPIFRGGNFRFKVKKFIDEAVELAKTASGSLRLYENFYEGKSLPSETSRVVQQRIFEATGRRIGVDSSATLSRADLVCDWRIGDLRCRTVGFDELAHDVLEIAKVMARKPAKKGEFYDLDELWDDLVPWAL